MRIAGDRNDSRLALCLTAAPAFQLRADDAVAIIEAQIATIRGDWDAVCDEAGLNRIGRDSLWGRQFLNPYAFGGWPYAFEGWPYAFEGWPYAFEGWSAGR